ncbi:MAG: hypothetical protein HQK49_09945 [Oligoflexia bacterium]|nr:hypothetical protein [Oligoflexia bacterium]
MKANNTKIILTLFCLLILLLLSSCSEKIEIKVEGENKKVTVDNINIKIDEYTIQSWEVGINKKSIVTSNIAIIVIYPPIGKDKFSMLTIKYPIDSWIIRVKKKTRSTGYKIIGYTIIPFNYQDLENHSLFNGDNRVSIKLAYDASFPTAWIKYPCPPIEHKKLVEEINLLDVSEINGNKDNLSLVNKTDVYPHNSVTIDDRDIYKPDASVPVELTVGSSMLATISFEFALYSQKDKLIYSEFIPSRNVLEVAKESDVEAIDCNSYNPKLERHSPKKYDFMELKRY